MVSQSHAIPVLVTRPQPQADRFANALLHRYGDRVRPILSPLLAPVYLRPDLPPGNFGAVVLTSETGARAAARLLEQLPKRAYCVGDRTAQVARDLGFDAISANGDVDDLLRLLQKWPGDSPFLHLRGREAKGALAAHLGAQGIKAAEAVIYAQNPQALSPEAESVLLSGGDVVAPLFSPRSARVFQIALANLPQTANLKLVALSMAVAEIFVDVPSENLRIANMPTQAELFLAMDGFIIDA